MCLLLLPPWCWMLGVLKGSAFFFLFQEASVSFVILILRKAIELLGLVPEGLCLTTDPLTAKEMAILSYYMAVMFSLDVRRQVEGGEVTCPLGESCPIHPSSHKIVNCHFLWPEDTSPEFFLKLISKSDDNSHIHLVRHREVLCNPKMS